ncbi:CCA tRNA nucleotidyltransferase [Sulfitobacter sabulilitoris]|uniref:CCA tRNA nucleotidyltransferase n=1 Tax=Sulfitobacter sabulilitoris TaxID=2562655 RepID=A0A5S3PEZ3_9RHOB|nr:CCA tRNA nucleotidyltransferase [Sulfitobacter sabulilitoris]TMM52624.1 CCA tRNA nucleotidyltransferase [Sulfitobacter sabulilitoris]
MDRPNDPLIPAYTPWLHDPHAQAVCDAIASGGYQILFVGGCVRNALLGRSISDVDLATDAHPDRVCELATKAGLKAVPTGIEHGTITVVAGGTGFEVTTFRRDVETDGRRAVVMFSDRIEDDARRRDFTMNALYARPDGTVVDPLGGLPDLRAGRVRFIENADDRITEDYLRILRYFRFHAWYANPENGFDPDALDAISRNSSGLESLSAERIGAEICKLLSAPDPVSAVAQMRQTGALVAVLPGSDDTLLGPVVHLEPSLEIAPDCCFRLAVLGGEQVTARLRLSKADARQIEQYRAAFAEGRGLDEVAYRSGGDVARKVAIFRAALANRPVDATEIAQIDTGAAARFPVTAKDLMPGYKGKALGDRLDFLERRWIASGFRLTRDDLLTMG